MKKLFSIIAIIVLGVIAFGDAVHAGFGITPPYVRNSSLIRNSVYEQEILLVRSDPTTELKAEITLDAPGINEWFTIDKGREFILPEGEQKVPMTVQVRVPEDAEFQNYTGNIRVKTSASENTAGAVNISLGAQIDIDLTVIDKEIEDFRVRKIGIHDLNEGHKVGWLYFPGKIRFDVSLENTGNVPVAPSKVEFRLYDPSGQKLLETTEHTNKIPKVEPFLTETVTAELPTRLPVGTYIARYKIYNNDEVKQSGEVSLNILPYGTLDAAGYGFWGLSIAHKVSVLLPVTVVLGLIIVILIRSNAVSSMRSARRSRKTVYK